MSESSSPAPSPAYFHGPFQQLVGYDILKDESGPYFTMPIRRDHLNPHGVLHGGVPLTLLDAIGGRVLIDQQIPGSGLLIRSTVTATLTVDFMRAIDSGVLYASGTPDFIGKTLAYVSVKVTRDALDGELIARGIGTYRVYAKSLVKEV